MNRSIIGMSLIFLAFLLNGQVQEEGAFKEDLASEDALIQKIKESKQYQRKQWYLERRKASDGSAVNIDKNNQVAYNKLRKQLPSQKSAHGTWQFLGHSNTTGGGSQGRINKIDIHPTDDTIIYVSTPNGGIWKTTNGGLFWTPLTDHLGLLSFADLEISSQNPDLIFALSGDGNPARDPDNFHGGAEVWSAGIFKSNDGGSTWERTNYELPYNLVPTKLLMHPSNSNIQFMVCNRGIFRTTDSWDNQVSVWDSLMVFYDIEFHPTNPQIMYASGENTIWKSLDMGISWVQVVDSDFTLMDTAAARVELAVTPDFPSYVAAIAGNWLGGSRGIYINLVEGADNFWVLRDTVTDIIARQAEYNMALAIDPSNYNKFYGGGVDLWKSTNEGGFGSWTNVGTGSLHVDLHDVVIRNGKIYAATDGGLYVSSNEGASWTDISAGLQISEIYRISGTQANSDLYLTGTQDNGMLRRQSGELFTRVFTGDGMESWISNSNPNLMYGTRERANSIYRSVDAFNNYTTHPVPGRRSRWITPFLMDPVQDNILFMGRDSVSRSTTNGTSWEYIGLQTTARGFNCMVQGKNDRNIMYATREHRFYRSENVLADANSVTWTQHLTGLPISFITDVEVDPSDATHGYVTFGNYDDGLKVYEFNFSGNSSTLANISGSLPNIPILCMEYHNDGSGLDRLYIGTDIGVFYRDNNIGDWIYFSNNMPAVPVEDLYINHTANTIAAGTYGRGLWRSNLIQPCPNTVTFSPSIIHKGQYHYTYNQTITAQSTVSKEPGTSIFFRAGDRIEFKPGFIAPAKSLFNAEIGGCHY